MLSTDGAAQSRHIDSSSNDEKDGEVDVIDLKGVISQVNYCLECMIAGQFKEAR